MARMVSIEQIVRSSRVDDLLPHVVSGEQWLRASVALQHVRSYLRAATAQQRRISHANKRISTAMVVSHSDSGVRGRRRRTESVSAMAAEIHFYFICWNAVGRNLRLIQEVTNFATVRAALRPHAALFKNYTDMRDHLEHFDDRLRHRGERGRRGREKLLKRPSDMGSFSREVYSFGGEEVAVGSSSLVKLGDIVERVVAALKDDSWQAISRDQPSVARRIIGNYLRDRHLRQVMKQHGLKIPVISARRGDD